jgi:hypothetical protein
MTGDKVVSETVSVTKRAASEGVRLVKKAWSIMDAAAEKLQPKEYLSQRAIESIQGKRTD